MEHRNRNVKHSRAAFRDRKSHPALRYVPSCAAKRRVSQRRTGHSANRNGTFRRPFSAGKHCFRPVSGRYFGVHRCTLLAALSLTPCLPTNYHCTPVFALFAGQRCLSPRNAILGGLRTVKINIINGRSPLQTSLRPTHARTSARHRPDSATKAKAPHGIRPFIIINTGKYTRLRIFFVYLCRNNRADGFPPRQTAARR